MAKVTISVAVYNVEEYMEELVRSLYEQTLEDLEILLVDDCTPDDSIGIALRVLDEYPNRKGQVRVVRHEHNMGIAATKKDGYLLASGEYVAVIDSDDYLDVHYAEHMYEKAVSTNADMVICDFYNIYRNKLFPSTIIHHNIVENEDIVKADMINRISHPLLWCKLIRKKLIVENAIMWPQGNLGEDTVLSPMFAYYSKKISHVPEPLYYYRVREDSASHFSKKTPEQTMELYHSFLNNVEIFLQFLEREGISEQYKIGVFFNKLRAKNRIRYQIGHRKFRKLWLNTYPEINKILLFGNEYYKPRLRVWIWFISLMLGIPSIKRLRGLAIKCTPQYCGIV